MGNTEWPYEVEIAGDIAERDGICIYVYLQDEIVLVIFRDDAKKVREFTLYKSELPLSVKEKSIEIFKREIPWDCIDNYQIGA